MRVRLKGINSVQKHLADGSVKEYWYAWKGGPRLDGKPGSPQFIASYNKAVYEKLPSSTRVLSWILDRYLDSADFAELAVRTRADYRAKLDQIEFKFGAFPISGLSDKRARSIFMDWRDQLAKRSLRQADYTFAVLARVLSWANDRGLIDSNPCVRGGRLYRGTRADFVWRDEDEAALLAAASEEIGLALKLAIWTGQRQGDLLKLAWSAYDGAKIRLRQSKTGARVVIPVAAELKAALDTHKRRSPIILVNSDGKPWTADGFRSSWSKTCQRVGIVGLTFNDLRGTAVTRLAIAGATEAEIASITGHSLSDVRSILDAHYLHRDPALAESAIRKLEKRTKSPN
jgi:integrase